MAAAAWPQKRMLREWEGPGLDAAIAASIDEFAAAFATGEPQRYMGEFLRRRQVGKPLADP